MTKAVVDVEESLSTALDRLAGAFAACSSSLLVPFDYHAVRRECAKAQDELEKAHRPIGRLLIFFPAQSSTASLALRHAKRLAMFADSLVNLTRLFEQGDVLQARISELEAKRRAVAEKPAPKQDPDVEAVLASAGLDDSVSEKRAIDSQHSTAKQEFERLERQVADAFDLLEPPDIFNLTDIWQAANSAIRARNP